MGILPELLRTIVHLSCVAIDIVVLLLLFRIIGQWRRIKWVERINQTAKDIVDPLHTAVSRRWQSLTSMSLSQRRALAVSVLTLSLARLVLCGIAGLLA